MNLETGAYYVSLFENNDVLLLYHNSTVRWITFWSRITFPYWFHKILLYKHQNSDKVQILWEGHRILKKIPRFILKSISNIKTKREIFSNFCGLLNISELYSALSSAVTMFVSKLGDCWWQLGESSSLYRKAEKCYILLLFLNGILVVDSINSFPKIILSRSFIIKFSTGPSSFMRRI